jgi:PIN domain nuclease of toxin-antitoxin system
MTDVPKPLVADTHVLVWYLQDDPQLSAKAGEMLDAAVAAGDPIFVSAATVVELNYLRDKGKISADYRWYVLLLETAGEAIEVAPVDLGVARAVEMAPRDSVPDPIDRMIAATSVALGAPLVTRDRKLRALPAVETVW